MFIRTLVKVYDKSIYVPELVLPAPLAPLCNNGDDMDYIKFTEKYIVTSQTRPSDENLQTNYVIHDKKKKQQTYLIWQLGRLYADGRSVFID